jgi:hypothetical protein
LQTGGKWYCRFTIVNLSGKAIVAPRQPRIVTVEPRGGAAVKTHDWILREKLPTVTLAPKEGFVKLILLDGNGLEPARYTIRARMAEDARELDPTRSEFVVLPEQANGRGKEPAPAPDARPGGSGG